jgi:hypothetical protein
MAITTDFTQEELKYINGGIVGGQYFQTLIQAIAVSGTEKRFNIFSVPLFRGQLTNLSLNEHELSYLQDFFIRRRATQQGFRWRNPIDYKATHYKEGVLDIDPDTWTIGGVMEPSGAMAINLTPAKIYVSKGLTTKKPLYLARGSEVKLYEAGLYTRTAVTNENGTFSYVGDPSTLSIEVEFDTPIWFTQNEWPTVIQGVDGDEEGLFKISTISIEERLLDFSRPSINLPN